MLNLRNFSTRFSGFRHQILSGSLMRLEQQKRRRMANVPFYGMCSLLLWELFRILTQQIRIERSNIGSAERRGQAQALMFKIANCSWVNRLYADLLSPKLIPKLIRHLSISRPIGFQLLNFFYCSIPVMLLLLSVHLVSSHNYKTHHICGIKLFRFTGAFRYFGLGAPRLQTIQVFQVKL